MKIILAAAVVALAAASSPVSANTDTCVRKTVKLNPLVSAIISGCELAWWGAYIVPGNANKGKSSSNK